MPRDLFGNVTRPSISIGNRKWYTLPLSLFSHSAIVLALIALPILAPAVMPSVFADDDLTAVIKILPPPPPPPARPVADRPKSNHLQDAVPITPPDGISPEKPPQDPIEYDTPGIVVGPIGDANLDLVPPPEVKRTPDIPAPVRVGAGVRTPTKTRHVDPVYSTIALTARVQGIVIIEATIGPEGRIQNARILRSVPLLDQSALDAVRQWEFTPTLLNGVPVPVIMTVTVSFTLR